MRHATMLACFATTAAVFSAGCKEQSSPAEETVTENTAPSGPAWVLTSLPADAQSVTQAKASAAEGDTIVLRGIIGGNKQPITSESPVFRVVDAGLYNRCTSEDDHCTTPWDYCCAASEDIVSNSATVQLVNADGAPYTGDPIADGLSPLDEVVIVGHVGPRPTADVLMIHTTGVYRIED